MSIKKCASMASVASMASDQEAGNRKQEAVVSESVASVAGMASWLVL